MSASENIQKSLAITVKGLVVPITVLNLLGGVISGVWLAIEGEWDGIFKGILFMLVSGFAVSIALIPSLLFAAPAAAAIKKGRKLLGIFFGSLGILYVAGLMTAWCILIMWLFVGSADKGIQIPLLVWSYGVALAPWMWLAQKEQKRGRDDFSMFSIFFAQIAYVLGMILFFFGGTLGAITVVFSTVMLIGGILQFSIAFGGELKKSFSNKELKEAFTILEMASQKFGTGGFDLVKEKIEKSILSDTTEFMNAVREGRAIPKYVYSMIANVSGDMVESGRYHIYRGVINPVGPGEDLLNIFDSAMDELAVLGDMDKKNAEEQKEAIRKNILNMG